MGRELENAFSPRPTSSLIMFDNPKIVKTLLVSPIVGPSFSTAFADTSVTLRLLFTVVNIGSYRL